MKAIRSGNQPEIRGWQDRRRQPKKMNFSLPNWHPDGFFCYLHRKLINTSSDSIGITPGRNMKTKTRPFFLLLTITGFALPANAAISITSQVEGWLGSNKTQVTTTPGGATQISYDATGIDKLVVVLATESGFNNRSTTAMTVSFNGVAMTLARFQNSPLSDPAAPDPINDNGAVAIFYLDNPFQGAATFSSTQTHTAGGSNGGHVSILGLTGTKDGVGAVNGTSYTGGTAPWSTTLTTTGANSLVIAGFQNSGSNNAGTQLATPTVGSGFTLSNNGNWNSNWAAGASAYQLVPTSGTAVTPAFEGGGIGTYRDVAAVEFLVPEPSAALLGGLGMLALLRRRRG